VRVSRLRKIECIEWNEKLLMRLALHEAAKGRGCTHPNPAVGAVVFRDGRVQGVGFHKVWGTAHAEIRAMRAAGRGCRGADLYVTLEPCCHHGKTPPCTEKIIGSGIRRVLAATRDPNPAVNGKGFGQLKRAGIEVHVGLCASEARKLNETYFKYMKYGRPFVTLKVAQTLDGKIAHISGESRWITGAAGRRLGRQMRAEAQAILVGVGTVVKDDPMLLPAPRRKRDYVRCILDSGLSIPMESRLVRTARRYPTIVYCVDAPRKRKERLESAGVMVKRVSGARAGGVRLRDVLEHLGSIGVMHLFVEGGSAVSSAFLRAGLVDKCRVFIAPKVMGDIRGLGSFSKLAVKRLDKCYGFRLDETQRVGEDVLITVYPKRR
jgi:diaminohydroxyphosphoribosylaminopyrimidine deaminase/5-amino-6-(5-phosphoribosylamino)uracil reductase